MNSIVEGKATFDISQIVELEKNNATLNQTIGAQKETIKILEKQNSETTNKHKVELEKAQKEVKIVSGNQVKQRMFNYCPNCDKYHTYKTTSCSYCGYKGTIKTGEAGSITYKNLDETVELIRKEESKKIKADVINLETKISDIEFDLDKKSIIVKELKRKTETDVTDAKSKLRKIHVEEIDKLKKRIKELTGNKTDAELEAKRIEELADLKLQIEHLESKVKAYAGLSLWKKWQFVKEEKLAKDVATKEVVKRERRIKSLSDFNWYHNVKNWLRDNNMFIWSHTQPSGRTQLATARSAAAW